MTIIIFSFLAILHLIAIFIATLYKKKKENSINFNYIIKDKRNKILEYLKSVNETDENISSALNFYDRIVLFFNAMGVSKFIVSGTDSQSIYFRININKLQVHLEAFYTKDFGDDDVELCFTSFDENDNKMPSYAGKIDETFKLLKSQVEEYGKK